MNPVCWAASGLRSTIPRQTPTSTVYTPSVVTITTVSAEIEISPFSHLRRPREVQGLGTGFLFDKTGVVLTNNHVVEGATSVRVKLSDERELPGEVVGTDQTTDIAVVRIDAKGLRPLPLGDSDALEVGVDFDHGQDEAKIDGHGLFHGEEVEGHLIDLALEAVDGHLSAIDEIADGKIADPVGFDGALDGLLRHAGHDEELFLEVVQVLLKTDAHHYPNLPVM